MGLLSIGYGKTSKYFDNSIAIGHTPDPSGDILSVAGSSAVKTDVPIFNRKLSPYLGISLVGILNDRDTYIILPKKYPEGYYPPTGIRSSLFTGMQYGNDDVAIFFEVSTLDLYLETYIRSDYNLEIQEISTYGLGWKIFLD